MTTYLYSELDAVAQTAACRYASMERGMLHEKNWPEFFKVWRFYADGMRAF